MEIETLKALEVEVAKTIPGFKVAYKDESKTQALVAFFVSMFNPKYATRFTSTFYPVVYFPSKASYEGSPNSSFTVLAHEFVHLFDEKRDPLFKFSYVVPQALSLVGFLLYVILERAHSWPLAVALGGLLLGCLASRVSQAASWITLIVSIVGTAFLAVYLSKWHSLYLFGGMACLAPWPAPWRVNWELRGYTMTVAILYWVFRANPQTARDLVVPYFIRSDYYFMSWSKSAVVRALDEQIERLQKGELQTEEPYRQVYAFLEARDLLWKA